MLEADGIDGDLADTEYSWNAEFSAAVATRNDAEIERLLQESGALGGPEEALLMMDESFEPDVKSTPSSPTHPRLQRAIDTWLSVMHRGTALVADQCDCFGQTPLLWAAKNGHATIVQLLLSNCPYIRVNVKDQLYGRTPLIWACAEGYEDTVRLLLGRPDVSVNCSGYYGRTPLMYAAERGNTALARMLLGTNAANLDLRDHRHSLTALEWAERKGHHDTAKLLSEHPLLDGDEERYER